MKVGLIQVDGKWWNLALLKLSAWHKKRGDEVTWIDLTGYNFDRTYGSKIFMGGSGYDMKAKLPDDIEHVCPDYEQFNLDHSIGFTSRGCIRNCEFCIVREKEGYIKEWADFSKFVRHQKVVLLDNNFLASPNWKKKLEYIIANNMKVSFNQGLDIRLITEENAELLSKVKYYDYKFHRRRLYFAFDWPKLEPIIIKNVKVLNKHGIPSKHLMFYVLVNFSTTFEQDYRRFQVLDELGCLPFIMIYDKPNAPQKTKDFARWVNKRYYKVVPFEEYDRHYRRGKK